MAARDHEEAQLRSVALQNARSIDLARRRAEEALRKQSEWLRVTLSSIGDGVISTDIGGQVSFMNGMAEVMTGWSSNEALGQALDDVFRIVNESTREKVENPAARVLREGTIAGLANHTILIAKDGTERPIDDSAAPICDDEGGRISGCVLVFRDVTERRRAERALSRSERELAEFFENANVGLHWVGPDGIILRANQAELDLLGYSREEYVGRHIAEFHADRPVIDAILTRLTAGEILHEHPARLRCKDRSIRYVLINSSGFFDNGKFIHSRCVTHDITERQRAEETLAEANRRKDEFLATLSHELRNPLAPIRNAVQILKTISPTTPTLEWCRDLIDKQVSQMARLMEDLLDLTRITRNALELRKQPADLRAVIEGAIETSRPLIETGRHKLTIDLPAQKMMLDGDAARLMQVFANLLNNAAKYTEADGEIHVTAVVRSLAQDGLPEVVVAIKDNGIGIASELLPQVFEMFFQADRSKERHYGGLGIGLTLARHIVQIHGGVIEVKSDGLGKGSEFVVRLPLAKESAEHDQVSVGSGKNMGLRSQALSRSVLVVDDNKNQVESIAMLLKILGCEVRAAHDGISALEALKEFIPEFALIDIGLPGIDGFELARRIRQVKEFNKITLIAQTGWGREEDREESRQAGFNYHLVKPLDFQLLERILTGARPTI